MKSLIKLGCLITLLVGSAAYSFPRVYVKNLISPTSANKKTTINVSDVYNCASGNSQNIGEGLKSKPFYPVRPCTLRIEHSNSNSISITSDGININACEPCCNLTGNTVNVTCLKN